MFLTLIGMLILENLFTKSSKTLNLTLGNDYKFRYIKPENLRHLACSSLKKEIFLKSFLKRWLDFYKKNSLVINYNNERRFWILKYRYFLIIKIKLK